MGVVAMAGGLGHLALRVAVPVRALAELLHLCNLLTIGLGEELDLQGSSSHLNGFTGLQGHSLL